MRSMGTSWIWGGSTLLLVLQLHAVLGAYKLVCYYTNWSQYREGAGKFTTAQVDPKLCTHLIYAFASIDEDNMIVSIEKNDAKVYKQFNDLKKRNSKLITMLSVGGWNFGSKFSSMLSTSKTRKTFIGSVIKFLRTYGFNGIDLDFEFPGQNGSPSSDRHSFTLLVQEMLSMLKAEATSSRLPRLLMSAAVSAAKETIDAGYEISELGKSLDFINVMTYDFHGSWEKITGHNSPLCRGKTDQGDSKYYNIEFAMNYWKDKGVPAGKLLMGFATYGRTFKLASSSSCDIGVPATGPGAKGKYTGDAGMLAYYEICSILPKATVKFSNDQKVPYACNGNNWIGYDNRESYRYKVDFLKAGKFGGAMVWTIDMDDFQGTFCKEGKYPLISRLKQLLGLKKRM